MSALPQVGDRVDRYRLVERLGAGGMGAVFRARDEEAGLERALKVLPSRVDPDALARFAREGKAMARAARHPHVVQVMHGGEVPAARYLVMELATGGDLQARLEQPVPPEQAARWARDLADALAHVHAQGVLHRDLKPANVVFDAEGAIKLTDFGLAAVADTQSLTESGMVLGTPAYMAPEQARCAELDARTDVYGLGAILYHLLTGRPAFAKAPTLVLLGKVAGGEFPPPREVAPDVPEGLDAICRRAMATDPAQRYPSAAALRDDLERWLAGTWASPSGSGRRRGLLLAAAAAAIACGAALVAARTAEGPADLALDPAPPPASPTAAPRAAAAIEATLRAGRPEEARGQLARAADEVDTLSAALELGELALVFDELDLAERCFARGRDLAPRDPRPWTLGAWVELFRGRKDRAKPRYEEALQRGIDPAAARVFLWGFKEATTTRPPPQVEPRRHGVLYAWIRARHEFRLHGAAARSRAALERLVRARPWFVRAWEQLATICLELQDLPAARRAWDALRRLRPDDARVHGHDARLSLYEGDDPRAYAAVQRLLALKDVAPADVELSAGGALLRLGRYEEALEQLERAKRRLPRAAQPRVLIARVYVRMTKGQEALDALAPSWVVRTRSEALPVRGLAWLLVGETERARADLAAYLERGIPFTRMRLQLEQELAWVDRDVARLEALQRKIEADPNYTPRERVASRLILLLRRGRRDEAEAQYRRLKAMVPASSAHLHRRIDLAMQVWRDRFRKGAR